MKAILLKEFGPPENMYLGDFPKPSPQPNEVLVKIRATALNRADTLQRMGKYPPPPGDSTVMGLEIAGDIVELGNKVKDWTIGDRVCGLIGGGGYAEYAVLSEGMLLPIPTNLSYEEAAAIPEVFLTAFQSINWIANLKKGESILIHAGASGVGTAAIQIAKAIGATVYVTASASKHAACLALGADKAIDYKNNDFEAVILETTNGKGVDVVIDFVAAPYLQKNINVLSLDGRMVLLALLGGIQTPSLNIMNLLVKRLQITGSTLRSRHPSYKVQLTQALKEFAWHLFEDQSFKPIIDSVYDWKEVVKAHTRMESNLNIGKLVLKVS